jgi:chromosome segregation ATPase
MDVKFLSEIARLNTVKEAYKQSYVSNLEYLEEKLDRINSQIERTTSELKMEILEKQKGYYETEIAKLDETMEKAIKDLDSKLAKIEAKHRELEDQAKKKCESFDFNLENLRVAIKRRNTNDIYDMFESTANALSILRKESSSYTHEQTSEIPDLA